MVIAATGRWEILVFAAKLLASTAGYRVHTTWVARVAFDDALRRHPATF
tara:strand:- start:555 stop:701 length:147 start_codon:yes stop_codon:yes gene_type:complete